MKIKIYVIAKNELKNIVLMHRRLEAITQKHNIEYIYIDGDSIDGTQQYLLEAGIPYKQQKYPGRGGAIRTALEDNVDLYVIFSPDGNECIEDIPKFIEFAKNGSDLIIASRMMKGAHNEEDGSLIKPRKWANNAFNMAANLAFNSSGKFVTDSINGFRAVNKTLLEKIELSAFDYTIEYQMTMRAMKVGAVISEFPTYEGQRVFGQTGAPSISTGIAFIKRFLSELFNV